MTARGRRKVVRYPFANMRDTMYYDRLGVLRRLRVFNTAPSTGGTPQNRFNVTMRQDTVDLAGRPLYRQVTCDSMIASDTTPGAPCGSWQRYRTATRYNRVGELVIQSGQAYPDDPTDSSLYNYDASGNRVQSYSLLGGGHHGTFLYPDSSNRVSANADTSGLGAGTNTVYKYDLSGSRIADSVVNHRQRQFYQYDAAERMAGMVQISPTTDTFADTLRNGNTCHYDPDGRRYKGCGVNSVAFSGDNVTREQEGDWWYVTGPGLDEPILVVKRMLTGSDTLLDALYPVVSAGNGQLVAIADTNGELQGGTINSEAYQVGFWNSSGLTGHAQTFNPRRQSTPGPIDTISTFRTRQYDPATGVWLQEDPIGIAGGVNLYQYNGNDPNSYSDPFGTCPPNDDNIKDCTDDDLGNAWRTLNQSKAGRRVINDYVKSKPTVDTAGSKCPAGTHSCTDTTRTSVHVTGTSVEIAVRLAHEIVHVLGHYINGTSDYVKHEEGPAWGRALQVYKELSPADQQSVPEYGRINAAWESNRGAVMRELACEIVRPRGKTCGHQ
jgi:hypothetical protein